MRRVKELIAICKSSTTSAMLKIKTTCFAYVTKIINRPICLRFIKRTCSHNNKMEVINSEQSVCDKIKEGKAEVEIPGGNVFYNPVQEFNRDLR